MSLCSKNIWKAKRPHRGLQVEAADVNICMATPASLVRSLTTLVNFKFNSGPCIQYHGQHSYRHPILSLLYVQQWSSICTQSWPLACCMPSKEPSACTSLFVMQHIVTPRSATAKYALLQLQENEVSHTESHLPVLSSNQ